jgi:hypothetical protein
MFFETLHNHTPLEQAKRPNIQHTALTGSKRKPNGKTGNEPVT